MDDLDRAQAHIEMMAAENVRMSKRSAGPDPSLHYAKCLNCGAETHGRVGQSMQRVGEREMKPHIEWFAPLARWICRPFKGARRGHIGGSAKEAYRHWLLDGGNEYD